MLGALAFAGYAYAAVTAHDLLPVSAPWTSRETRGRTTCSATARRRCARLTWEKLAKKMRTSDDLLLTSPEEAVREFAAQRVVERGATARQSTAQVDCSKPYYRARRLALPRFGRLARRTWATAALARSWQRSAPACRTALSARIVGER